HFQTSDESFFVWSDRLVFVGSKMNDDVAGNETTFLQQHLFTCFLQLAFLSFSSSLAVFCKQHLFMELSVSLGFTGKVDESLFGELHVLPPYNPSRDTPPAWPSR